MDCVNCYCFQSSKAHTGTAVACVAKHAPGAQPCLLLNISQHESLDNEAAAVRNAQQLANTTLHGQADEYLPFNVSACCRDPEQSRVSAGSVVLLGMLEVLKVYAGQNLEVQEAVRRCLALMVHLLGQGRHTACGCWQWQHSPASYGRLLEISPM